jgi:cytochrome c553
VVDVVEAATVPKTVSAEWHLSLAPGGGTEPLGARIIEVPTDNDRFTSRDSRVRFIAYVPPGSIEKGRLLATTGADGRTVACGTCHGADLKGTGLIPPIIGRSPSFIVRQLFDIQAGNQTGESSALMKPTVEKLTLDDMIALAAYTSSLKP